MKKLFSIILTLTLILSFSSIANAQITKDQYYARSTLNGNELEYYDAVYNHVINNGHGVNRIDYGISEERYPKLWYCVYGDAPEMINKEEIYTGEEAASLMAQIKKKADIILLYIPKDATEYETVEYLYNWAVENIMYYYGYTPQEEAESQTIVGGLLREKAVCSGIARSLQYLLYQVDIPCYYVVGTFKGGLHAWDLIQINGEWYYADPTEDYFHKDGFLMTTEDLPKYNLWIDPEMNPPLPETPTTIPEEYREPEPTPTAAPTATPTRIAAPVVAEPSAPPEAAPVKAQTEHNNLWFLLLAAAAAVAITIPLMRRKHKKNA